MIFWAAYRRVDARNRKAYDVAMKAFRETLGDLGNPKPRKYFSPKWKQSDDIAPASVSLIVALIYGFWPLHPMLPQ